MTDQDPPDLHLRVLTQIREELSLIRRTLALMGLLEARRGEVSGLELEVMIDELDELSLL